MVIGAAGKAVLLPAALGDLLGARASEVGTDGFEEVLTHSSSW